MKNIHAVLRDLKGKTEIEENLTSYYDIMKNEVAPLSALSLAFEMVTLSDMLLDFSLEAKKDVYKECMDPVLYEGFESFLSLFTRVFVDDKRVTFSEVDSIRQSVTKFMQEMTDAVDFFTTSEFVLNRVEHRFEGVNKLPSDYSDAAYTDEILRKLARSSEDGQNLSIVRVSEQLPIRMTKSRFYDVVLERVSLFKETDRQQFLQTIALVKTSLGLKDAPFETVTAKAVKQVYDEMAKDKLTELTKDGYAEFKTRLLSASEALNLSMDIAVLLQNVLNRFLAFVLSEGKSDVEEEQKIIDTVKKMMQKIANHFNGVETNVDLLSELYASCEELEGLIELRQETYMTDSSHLEDLSADFSDLYKEVQFNNQLNEMKMMRVLLSNSSFVDLSSMDEENEMLPLPEYVTTVQALLRALSEHFQEINKNFVRAHMARFNAAIPMHFTSQEELEAYIYQSLSNCSDVSEKLGVIDVVNSILED